MENFDFESLALTKPDIERIIRSLNGEARRISVERETMESGGAETYAALLEEEEIILKDLASSLEWRLYDN